MLIPSKTIISIFIQGRQPATSYFNQDSNTNEQH